MKNDFLIQVSDGYIGIFYSDSGLKGGLVLELNDARIIKSELNTIVAAGGGPGFESSGNIRVRGICSRTKMNLAVWAGNGAVNTLIVNGKRFGANWGGAEYVIPMQDGETVTGLEYGIIQWDYDQDWSNSICGLYVVTNIQKHGMYRPCPTEYSVSIPDGVDFADFLVDDIIAKPSSTDFGYWITGFKSRIPV